MWPGKHDEEWSSAVDKYVAQSLGMARANCGKGSNDQPISQAECVHIYKLWDPTTATTPDLIPRSVFSVKLDEWHIVVWKLMDLTGPARLAVRPCLWRSVAAVLLFKRGSPAASSSYRLIMIKSQLGLLQEGILFQRISGSIRASSTPGQSGCIRDAGDAHLI